jgi:GT2 family glycosyltransferase
MISLVILNYNRKEDLEQTLTRLYWQQNVVFEVIVVDQHSLDGSVEMVQTLFPSVRLFALQENIGVAGGRNFGVMQAKGEYLVFLDDDAEFVGFDELRKVELVFSCNSNIHLIAFNINGHPEVPEKFKLFSVHRDKFVNGYIGCGHAIRKSTFENLGGYTKELFFWGEEIEFAIKVFTIPNGRILYKGDVVVFHRVSSQSRLKWKEGRFYYKVRNRLSISRKLFPLVINWIYIFYYSLAYCIRAIQLKEVSSYLKALQDFQRIELSHSSRLSWSAWIRFLFSR